MSGHDEDEAKYGPRHAGTQAHGIGLDRRFRSHRMRGDGGWTAP